jgi:hypothetical protein
MKVVDDCLTWRICLLPKRGLSVIPIQPHMRSEVITCTSS